MVYNDNEYAVVDACFGDLQNGKCDKTKRQVEIWSRKAEVLPLEKAQTLKHLIDQDLCMSSVDVIDRYSGKYIFLFDFVFPIFLPAAQVTNKGVGEGEYPGLQLGTYSTEMHLSMLHVISFDLTDH